jgi:hypothetical protein
VVRKGQEGQPVPGSIRGEALVRGTHVDGLEDRGEHKLVEGVLVLLRLPGLG